MVSLRTASDEVQQAYHYAGEFSVSDLQVQSTFCGVSAKILPVNVGDIVYFCGGALPVGNSTQPVGYYKILSKNFYDSGSMGFTFPGGTEYLGTHCMADSTNLGETITYEDGELVELKDADDEIKKTNKFLGLYGKLDLVAANVFGITFDSGITYEPKSIVYIDSTTSTGSIASASFTTNYKRGYYEIADGKSSATNIPIISGNQVTNGIAYLGESYEVPIE